MIQRNIQTMNCKTNENSNGDLYKHFSTDIVAMATLLMLFLMKELT